MRMKYPQLQACPMPNDFWFHWFKFYKFDFIIKRHYYVNLFDFPSQKVVQICLYLFYNKTNYRNIINKPTRKYVRDQISRHYKIDDCTNYQNHGY